MLSIKSSNLLINKCQLQSILIEAVELKTGRTIASV